MKMLTEKMGTIVFVLSILIVIVLIVTTVAEKGTIYETSDLTDYRKISGNYDNDTPAKFIYRFFPECIPHSFSDVSYHYTARRGDAYACECYLEFVIEDEAEFHAFLSQYEDIYESCVFIWDNSFMQITLSNVFATDGTRASDKKGYPIHNAEIGKILYSASEQKIIFWALCVRDGGGVGSTQLQHFFDRFEINVLDYQMEAYFSYQDQEDQIAYKERYELNMPTFHPYPEKE